MINMYNTLFFQQESFFDGNSFEDGALSLLRTTSYILELLWLPTLLIWITVRSPTF